MSKKLYAKFKFGIYFGALSLMTACATSPLGRSQLLMVSDQEMSTLGAQSYEQMKKKIPISSDSRMTAYVQCVTRNVIQGLPPEYARQSWEVTLFDNKMANAFALPGGKIGVYTGLLKVAQNQDQLAAVLGHEVGHVIAKHSAERVSRGQLTNLGLGVIQVAMGAPSANKDALMGLLGLGAEFGVIMPFGRKQESEADLIGLDYLANAGFDPRASVQLWQNMGKASGNQAPPEFMSTHPSHETRIKDLENRMPQALPIYESARRNGRNPSCRM